MTKARTPKTTTEEELSKTLYGNVIVTDTHIFTIKSFNKEWIESTDTLVSIKNSFGACSNGEYEYQEGRVIVYERISEKTTGTDAEPRKSEGSGDGDSKEVGREAN